MTAARQSWNARLIESLKKQLRARGDTPEAFEQLVDFHELEPLDIAELSEQVRWPGEDRRYIVKRVEEIGLDPQTLLKPEQQVANEKAAATPMVIKRIAQPQAPPAKMIIKRY